MSADSDDLSETGVKSSIGWPIGGDPDAFPAIAAESMAGHLAFGLVLGAVFSAIVDLSDRRTPDPLEGDGERATARGER